MSSLYRHLLRYFLVASLAPMLVLSIWLGWDLQTRRHTELRAELREKTLLTKRLLEQDPSLSSSVLAHVAGRETGLRLTLIRADGAVLADSHEDPKRMENHRARPEFQEALRGGEGSSERHSATLNQDLLYVGMVVNRSGKPWAVIRGAIPLQRVQAELARLRWTVAAAFALAALGAALLAARFSGRLSDPVEAISRATREVRNGRWPRVSRVSGPEELRNLAEDVNRMIERLRALVLETEAARAQMETVFEQMEDGLIVLDGHGRLVRINAAALRLLGIGDEPLLGRSLLEVVPSYPLEANVRQVLVGERPAPIELHAPKTDAVVRAMCTALRGSGGPDGAILLLQDLTEVRRVDQMRRDFVVNVSHELRTPIAAVRALAETLVLRAERRPEIVGEYAVRLAGEAERVGKLVDDLLTLSRVQSGRWDLYVERLQADLFTAEVVQRFQALAESRGVRLAATSDGGACLRGDRNAIATALGNLVENALKYTPSGGCVTVSAEAAGDEVRFVVSDTGVGIPSEDLVRIFERFYRVDRARSREVEGTGLGLAIVKHLSENQGGRVWAKSELGHGSRFYIALPAAETGAPIPLPG